MAPKKDKPKTISVPDIHGAWAPTPSGPVAGSWPGTPTVPPQAPPKKQR